MSLRCVYPKNLIISAIRLYQRVLSPDHSFWAKQVFPHGFCRFAPTCSMYMINSIEKRGLVLGWVKGLWRVVRCNPWGSSGVDEV
jgi:uncharacterized protein